MENFVLYLGVGFSILVLLDSLCLLISYLYLRITRNVFTTRDLLEFFLDGEKLSLNSYLMGICVIWIFWPLAIPIGLFGEVKKWLKIWAHHNLDKPIYDAVRKQKPKRGISDLLNEDFDPQILEDGEYETSVRK